MRAAVDEALAIAVSCTPIPNGPSCAEAIAAVHASIRTHSVRLRIDGTDVGAGAMPMSGPAISVAMTEYGYLFMRTLAKMVDATLEVAPERDYRVDVDALLDVVDADTRLVFVVNPGNPSGTVIPNDEIRRLRAALADDVLLLVDEAYSEFVEPGFQRAAVRPGRCRQHRRHADLFQDLRTRRPARRLGYFPPPPSSTTCARS